MRNRPRQRPTIRRRGFTLLEVALAIVLLGVGVVAMQALVGSTTRVTIVSNELQTSTMLASAMHERCLGLGRGALLNLHGVSYSPPVDSQAATLSELSDYTQTLSVQYVPPGDIRGTSATATDLLRITVAVSRQGREVLSTSRLIATTRQD